METVQKIKDLTDLTDKLKQIGTQAKSASEVLQLEKDIYNSTGCKTMDSVISEVSSAFNIAVQ